MNAPNHIQAERTLRIDGLLGADQLLAERLTMRESINDLFTLSLHVRSKRDDIAPAEMVGKLADVSLDLGEGQRRNWNALVTDIVAGPKIARKFQSYQITLRPQLWLLSQKSDCRIWLDMTAVEVCEMLLGEHGLPAPITKGVVQDVPKQHYSVQYNETDLAYLSRRLEEDGLFYWFSHEVGQHVLNIANFQSGYTGGEEVRFAAGSTDRNHINRFETRFSYTPGQRAARDWNFETPGTVPEGSAPSLVSLPGNGGYELFEYPMIGGYGDGARASEGIADGAVERQIKLRMQAAEAGHCRVEGASNTRTLAAGARFTPYDMANPSNTFEEHVILAIEHEAVDQSYETGTRQADYTNRFLALPSRVPATPHRLTARPRIDGSQIAIVAGPEGEEIHPDEYGRIKLWFPWDRKAKKDGSDTCWIRVMQNWAGSGWGGQIIPRIGMEVMVSFLEGNPDRPMVTGVVPNSKQRVPYALPAAKTKSVFRTNTHKGDGFNELSFEDEAGEELIYMHGQLDQAIEILHDRTKDIGNDQSESIGRDKRITVGQDHTEAVGRNQTITIGQDHTENLARDLRHTIGRDVYYEVIQNQQEKYGKDHIHYVGNILKQDIFADHMVAVGRNFEETVKGSFVLNVNQSITSNTKQHVLMAFEKFQIKGPGGKITIDGSGITLEAAQINLKGNVSMGGGGGAQVPTLAGAANAGLPLCEECMKQKGES